MTRYVSFILAAVMASAIALAAEPATKPAPGVDPVITAFLKPIDAAPGDSELQQKLKERHNLAVRLLELRVEEHRRGIVPLSTVYDTARTVVEDKMDLAQSDEDRVKVVEQVLEVSKSMEASQEKQFKAGFGSEADLDRAKLARLSAEVELLKLKESKSTTTPATRP